MQICQRETELRVKLALESLGINACEIEHESMRFTATDGQDHFDSIRISRSGKHTIERNLRETIINDIR
jgi:hypothetical protein